MKGVNQATKGQTMTAIPTKVLEKSIRGKNLAGATLGDELRRREITLLVFLRHFG